MNNFLRNLFLFLLLCMTVHNSNAASKNKVTEQLRFDLCFYNILEKSEEIQSFSYDIGYASLFSLNCNTPTMLTSGVQVSGNTTGGALFYQITIPPGQNANIAFTGVPGATASVINNCAGQTPIAGPYCGGGTYLIKISGTPGAFDLTVTAYSNTVTINITETGGFFNNDGILCVGDDIILNSNPVLTGGATVLGYAWSSGQATQGFTLNNVTLGDAGTYTVTVTDNSGCTSSSSVVVTVNPLPTATIAVTEMSGDMDDDGEICNGDQATLTASGGNTYAWSNFVNSAINVVTPTVTTVYTVTVTDINGCTDSEEQTITVHPLPTAGIDIIETSGTTNNDGDICETDPITLSGTGGATYEWNTGETLQDISPILAVGPHTFTVTVTDVNGCTDSEIVMVEVFAMPAITIDDTENSGIAANDETVCEDDALTLTVSFTSGSATTFDWSLPGGGTDSGNPLTINNTTIGQHNGTFTVTVTDVNGCTDSETIVITIEVKPVANDTELKACAIAPGSTMGDFVLTDAEDNPNYPTNQNDGQEVDNGDVRTVTYHTTLAGAQAGSGAVGDGIYTDGTILFVRVENTTTGCYDVSEVTLTVIDLPDALDTELRACAEFNDPTMADFTLTDAELAPAYPGGNSNVTADIDNGMGGMTITYHPTLIDAENNTGALSDGLYPSGTIFARIEDPATRCFDVAQIQLTVVALPVSSDTELRECEMPAGSGSAIFTLTEAEDAPGFPATNSNVTADIDNGLVRTVTYHATQQDAEDNVGALGNGSYPDMTTLYARVEDAVTGCASIAEVLLTVLEAPDPEIQYMGSPNDFTVCEDDAFDLNVVTTTGTAPLTYMWTLPNGSTGSGNPFPVPSADQAIHEGTWVVTVTDANGCTATDNIVVTIDPAPTNNSCGTAVDLGNGITAITASGNNVCGQPGGGCGSPDNEAAVYFTYTVPDCGLTSISFRVGGSHYVSAGLSCGGGGCSQSEEILCPDPGTVIYITVSSSDDNAGNYSLSVTPVLEFPPITGTVFVDLNINGTYEPGGDIPLANVSIAAYPDCDRSQSPILATTDNDGNYAFAMFPATPCQYMITMDPNSMVECEAVVEECVELDPCQATLPPILFPCPPPNCTSNPFSVDNICEDAFNNPLCDLRLIEQHPCGQNPSALGPWSPSPHCAGIFHNTSFYGFVAGSGDYTINFTIFNCAGSGVQYGIQDNCSPGGPYVVCNGNANTGTISIPSSGLIPCNTYVFWIDGWAGSVCSYYAWVSGDWNNCSVPPIEDITVDFACTPLCPSFNPITLTAVPEPGSIPPIEDIQGAEYTWNITGPNSTNFTTTIMGPDGISIDFPFLEPGTYEVCITTYHPCDGTSDPLCKEFTFETIPDTNMDFVVCTADFPWTGAVDENGEPINDIHGNQFAWFGGEITLAMIRTTPPTFNFSSIYQNECGCNYTQQLRITEATSATGIDTLAVCVSQVPYTYNGLTFTEAVTDSLIPLTVKSINGCDSLVSFTSRILNMGGVLRDDCVQGGIELQFSMAPQFINADRDSIKYVWKDSAGNILTDNNTDPTNIVVTNVGNYTLDVIVYKYGKGCSFPFSRTIDLTGRLPLAPIADNWPQKICENDNVATYNVLTPDPNLIYLWTVPPTATKVMDDSTGTLIVRWNGPTGGNICVKARNLCGDGPETCLPVVFVDQIVPDFSMATEICKDNITPITATSTHTATPIVYNWDFDGGTSANTNGTGPGPHNVAWNLTGPKTVTLSVTENGCTGDPVSKDIVVSELPPPPILNCAGSTSSSVTFGWSSVPGAVNYTVTVISPSGVSGTIDLNNNTYSVTGLALGASVTIQVTAVLTGPCGNVTSANHECTAEDCGTLPVITFTPIAPICLPGNSINLVASMLTVNPVIPNSTGSFFVNGTPATVFDPNSLGAGTHTILYDLEWDGGRCSQTGTTTVIVRPTPSSDFTVGPGGCVLDPVTVTYTGGTTGATYDWNFGPDVIGTYNGPGPHNVRWTNAGAKTITLRVTKDGCTSSVSTRNVTVNPVLAAPVVTCTDQRIDGVTFGWNPVPNASGYNIVVEVVGGAVIFSGTVTGTTRDVPGLTEGTQVKITVTAISTNGCPNTQGGITCTATSCPNARITFPNSVINECLNLSLGTIALPFTITNNLPNEVPTVTWSSIVPTVNSAINNSVNPATFNPQIAGLGTHSLVLTYRQKDCEWKDSILITLKPIPVASFTMDDRICIDDLPVSVNYTGTNTGGRILTWDNGGGTRQEINPSTFLFNFPTPGTFTVGLTTTLNGCVSNPFSRSIIVEDTLASPVITCSETLNSITFSWTAVPCATQFDIFVNGMPSGRQTARSFTASNLVEGERVVFEVRAISTCECPIKPVTETCTAKACPPVKITLTPAQLSICLTPNVAKVPIALNIVGNTSNGRGTWSGVGVDQNGLFDPAIAGLGRHEITYSYNDSNCDFVEKTSITVTELPRIIWEAVQPKCYNDLTGGFIFTIEGGTPPYRLTNDGVAVTGSPLNGVTAGSHTFVVTDANGCSSSQAFTITIPSQPSFTITGPAIVNINKDATHTLDLAGMAAYINVIDSVVWFWNGVRVCGGNLATCSSITNRPPVGPNGYVVIIYYNNGCRVMDDFQYIVTDTYITTFPNIINPESNTGNKIFRITTSDPSLFVNKMRVYDRWGNLVFLAENFSAFTDPVGWDGRFSGTDVVPGVYVYIFEMSSDSNDDIVETGDVTVVR